ncbi:tRNA (adenosine(37)-N6)-dimethylallyltransferase MiaA [Candidatus Kaiserbacteria bacterium]|nr:tRNA (adenosine(37)-N6)-dimethylallyltransferase MiaA [Candidatus Kaiserbacteria bacterium]
MRTKLKKIVAIVGPTASGKTALAITLAKQFDGEIVSADSRQVYRGLDIGTEKITMSARDGVTHHLIDIADPREVYTAADFLRDASAAIADIVSRGKLPVVAGGTFFYVDVLLGNRSVADVPADPVLRSELETLSVETLYQKLLALDPEYAEHVDRHNSRRLVRAIEIAAAKGRMPVGTVTRRYDACVIGIDMPTTILRERTERRLDATLGAGLVEETKKLLAEGVPEERLEEIGLEYRVVLAYLRGEYAREEMRTVLAQKIWQYAKRQLTWLKKMKGVQWVLSSEPEQAWELVKNFIS